MCVHREALDGRDNLALKIREGREGVSQGHALPFEEPLEGCDLVSSEKLCADSL